MLGDTDSDQEDSDQDIDDEDREVFVPADLDRELILVSRCCCHARRMRYFLAE